MRYRGKAYKFGDNVNTDEIIPARYLNTKDPAELGKYCMEGIDKDFAKYVEKNGIITAGRNFGCGSSREHAPISIKAAGVSCVIAESFARIFYRNAINIGLPIVTSPGAAKDIKAGDIIEVDTVKGKIKNLSRKKVYAAEMFPKFIETIIRKGGLLNSIR